MKKLLSLAVFGFIFAISALGQATHNYGVYIGSSGHLITQAAVASGHLGFTVGGTTYYTGQQLDGAAYDTIRMAQGIAPGTITEGLMWWNDQQKTLNLATGEGPVIQVGHEDVTRVYNNSGSVIPNGAPVHPSGGAYLAAPIVTIANCKTFAGFAGNLLVATQDIPAYSFGSAVIRGKVRSFDTSPYSKGDVLYLDTALVGGDYFTNVKPVFPNYVVQVCGVDSVSATTGILELAIKADPYQTLDNFHNGTFRESFDFRVSSDGVTITGTLFPGNGNEDMTMLFSDGMSFFDTSPAATITLTAGTDSVPVNNYVYIPITTKALTVSTTAWPTGEHIKVAHVVCQSALGVQLDDPRRNQNINDHAQGNDGMGHLAHMAEKIRYGHSEWYTGTEIGVDIQDGGASPDDVYLSITSGQVFQMHKQTVPALDMETGTVLYIVNDPDTAFHRLTNLNQIGNLSLNGETTNRAFNLVVWGVANKTGEGSQLYANLPLESRLYSTRNSTQTINDEDGYAVYTIPNQFRGVGFLIARLTLAVDNSGEWEITGTEDLRGQFPNTSAGGGAGGSGVSSFLALTDVPSSYTGYGGYSPVVNVGETALEFTDYQTTIDNLQDSLNTLWGLVDNNPPAPISAFVENTSPDTIFWLFDELVYGTVDDSMFVVFANDNRMPLDTTYIDGDTVKVALTDGFGVGVSGTIQYYAPGAGGGIADKWGNKAADIAEVAITNNITSNFANATETFLLDFEDNVTDLKGNYTTYASNSFRYLPNKPILNNKVGDFNGSNKYVVVEGTSASAQKTYMGSILSYGTNESYRPIVVDGSWEFYLNSVTGRYVAKNGTDSAYTDTLAYRLGLVQYWAVDYDTVTNESEIWIHGDNRTVDSTISSGFTFSDSLILGINTAKTKPGYFEADAIRGLIGYQTDAEAKRMFGGSGLPYDSIDVNAPILDTAYTTDVDQIVLVFDRNLKVLTPDTAAFELTEDGTPVTLFDPVISDGASFITFSCDTLSAGTTLLIDYTKTGNNNLENEYGYETANWTDSTVVNVLTGDSFEQVLHYNLDGGDLTALIDQVGSNDGVKGSGIIWPTSNWAGTNSASHDNGNNSWYYTGSSVTVGAQGSFACAIRYFNSSHADATILGNSNWKLGIDKDGEVAPMLFFELYGGSKLYSPDIGAYTSTVAWFHVGVTIDTATNVGIFYAGGDSVGTFTVPAGINLDGVYRWGHEAGGYLDPLWGYTDEPMIYSGIVPTNKFEYMNNNPGNMATPDGAIPPDPPTPPPIFDDMIVHWYVDFENRSVGDYPIDQLKADFPTTYTNSFSEARGGPINHKGNGDTLRIADFGGSKVIEVGLNPNTVDTKENLACIHEPDPLKPGEYICVPYEIYRNTGSGEHTVNFVWTDWTDEPDEIWFSFNVYFAADFDWSKGGKIMSVGGGPRGNDAGSTKPDETNGWDVILMWHENGALSWYIYHQNISNERYAQTAFWRKDGAQYYIPRGQWVNIAIRAKVNSPYTRNSYVEGFVNGVFHNRITGLEFNSDQNAGRGWNRWEFAHFRGGSDIGYFSTGDYTTMFDDFLLWQWTQDSPYPQGFEYSPSTQTIATPTAK